MVPVKQPTLFASQERNRRPSSKQLSIESASYEADNLPDKVALRKVLRTQSFRHAPRGTAGAPVKEMGRSVSVLHTNDQEKIDSTTSIRTVVERRGKWQSDRTNDINSNLFSTFDDAITSVHRVSIPYPYYGSEYEGTRSSGESLGDPILIEAMKGNKPSISMSSYAFRKVDLNESALHIGNNSPRYSFTRSPLQAGLDPRTEDRHRSTSLSSSPPVSASDFEARQEAVEHFGNPKNVQKIKAPGSTKSAAQRYARKTSNITISRDDTFCDRARRRERFVALVDRRKLHYEDASQRVVKKRKTNPRGGPLDDLYEDSIEDTREDRLPQIQDTSRKGVLLPEDRAPRQSSPDVSTQYDPRYDEEDDFIVRSDEEEEVHQASDIQGNQTRLPTRWLGWLPPDSQSRPRRQFSGQYATPPPSSTAPAFSGQDSHFASPTTSHFSESRQDSTSEADWRRRTWHPGTYIGPGPRPGTSGTGSDQTPDTPRH